MSRRSNPPRKTRGTKVDSNIADCLDTLPSRTEALHPSETLPLINFTNKIGNSWTKAHLARFASRFSISLAPSCKKDAMIEAILAQQRSASDKSAITESETKVLVTSVDQASPVPEERAEAKRMYLPDAPVNPEQLASSLPAARRLLCRLLSVTSEDKPKVHLFHQRLLLFVGL